MSSGERPSSDKSAPDGFATWNAYWTAQGMPWRTEPEIGEEQQRFLAERRATVPDIERGIYPFKDVKLDRADVEWLLATHESRGMRGPVDWGDPKQRGRDGLDLRGVDMRGANLTRLPLACLHAGLRLGEFAFSTPAQPELDMEPSYAMTEGLRAAVAHLEKAQLSGAHLENACLHQARLQAVNLQDAQLDAAFLVQAHLEGARLAGARLEGALAIAASFEGAELMDAHFEQANLRAADFSGSTLVGAHVEDADLSGATFSDTSRLNGAWLGSRDVGLARLVDVRWGGVNVALVHWVEERSRRGRRPDRRAGVVEGYGALALEVALVLRGPEPLDKASARLHAVRRALRATRQVALLLREQGLHDEADRFTYHAQVLHRQVLRRQRKFGAYVFSLFLATVTGYGYRLGRILIVYAAVILGFAVLFYSLAQAGWMNTHLDAGQSLVESLAAFHERAFSGFLIGSHLDPVRGWATFSEALIGLIIESTFIAMLVQRLRAGSGG